MTRGVFLLALFLASALVVAQPPKEPTHDGKPLSGWVKLLGSNDEAARRKAWDALREMGTHSETVIEKLIATAADPNDKGAIDANYIVAGFGATAVPALTRGLWSNDPKRRKVCLLAIRLIGADARPAAPSVASFLSDSDRDTRHDAVATLMSIGSHSSLAALRKARDDRDGSVRLSAAQALIELGADATEVLPVLSEALSSAVPGESNEAARLLGLLGPEAAPAVPTLVGQLAKVKAADAARLVETLGRIGPGAAETAIPVLRKIIADKEAVATLRPVLALALWRIARDPMAARLLREHVTAAGGPEWVIAALWRIEPGPETIATLTELLKSDKPEVAIAAAGSLGTTVKEAVPLLGKMLTHKEPAVRARAVVALTRLGPAAKEVAEALRGAMKDEVPDTAFWAAVAVCRLDPTPEAVAAVAGYLGDRQEQLRLDAAEVLGLLVSSGKPAVPRLLAAQADTDGFVRLAAAIALWRIEKHPSALPAAVEQLRSPNDRLRSLAAVDIGMTIGSEAKPALPELIKQLFDPFSSVRSATAETLGRVGPAAKDAAPALLALLQGDEPAFVQSAVCEALGLIQPADKDAATAVLKSKLDHPDPLTRVHAALALWLIAGDKSGEKEAERGLGYRTHHVRITAAEALWRMKQDARVVPLLMRTLEESNLDGTPNENERYMAARALGRIGPPAKPAVPELLKLVNHYDGALAATAAEALKSIDPEAAKKAGVK